MSGGYGAYPGGDGPAKSGVAVAVAVAVAVGVGVAVGVAVAVGVVLDLRPATIATLRASIDELLGEQ
jgi:hypothetical protein